MTGEYDPQSADDQVKASLAVWGEEAAAKTEELERAKVLGNEWGGSALDTDMTPRLQAKTPEEEALTKASIAFGRGALFDYEIAAQFGSNIDRPLQQRADTAVRIAAWRYEEEAGEYPPIDLPQAIQALVEYIADPPKSTTQG